MNEREIAELVVDWADFLDHRHPFDLTFGEYVEGKFGESLHWPDGYCVDTIAINPDCPASLLESIIVHELLHIRAWHHVTPGDFNAEREFQTATCSWMALLYRDLGGPPLEEKTEAEVV